nr:MAG TPA: hypothetical protein [Caudoviricetes sp.]
MFPLTGIRYKYIVFTWYHIGYTPHLHQLEKYIFIRNNSVLTDKFMIIRL